MPKPPPLPPAVRAHKDAALAVGVLALQSTMGALLPSGQGHRPDAAGWALLVVTALVLAVRRRWPMTVMLVMVAAVAPYHAMDNLHLAVVPASMVAIYSLAVAGPPPRTYLTVAAVVAIMVGVMSATPDRHAATDMLRSGGWVVAVALTGEAVRIHRKYVAAIVGRAERAERTREEEAARRVAEERLRIARDLHDLLAHSITLIGVQTSVAAHVLLADPDRLDRTAVAGALDGIAGTCRDARAELRATLQVLRGDDERGPLPGLAAVADLARSAEAAGARVELAVAAGADGVPPAIGAAAYRIVQEALTNAVRHAGAPRSGSGWNSAPTRTVAPPCGSPSPTTAPARGRRPSTNRTAPTPDGGPGAPWHPRGSLRTPARRRPCPPPATASSACASAPAASAAR